jgi:membrane protein required for colicin V production
MDWPDYTIAAIIVISGLVGVFRGFVKEAFALAIWVLAFLAAFNLSGAVAVQLESTISLPSARTAAAFIGVFLAVLLVGALLSYLVGKLVEKTGLSGTDRIMGGLFGLARGLLLVIVVVLAASLTPLTADPWWKASRGIQAFVPLAQWASEFLPESIAEHVQFEQEAEA